MKKLEFETSRGRFLLVDMVIDIWTPEDEKSSTLYLEGEAYQVMSCIKLSEITEEQSSQIVDEYKRGYKNYTWRNPKLGGQQVAMVMREYYNKAVDSLYSLFDLKGIHLFENPYKDTLSIQSLEGSQKHRDQIEEAEQKTFHNPYIFKICG